LAKAIDSCQHQDFVQNYLKDFIVYKFDSDIIFEFYEVRFTISTQFSGNFCDLYNNTIFHSN